MHGIFNIVPTPFDESGAVDECSLRRLIDFVIGTGVDGLTILGFLGEAAKLSEVERSLVIDITVGMAAGILLATAALASVFLGFYQGPIGQWLGLG